jgi:hypothetical protein
MRRVDGGFFVSFAWGRIGRGAKFPPQLGQTPPSLVSTQSRQNVHSNVQIIASVADGGKSLSQHSQLGRNSSMSSPRIPVCCAVHGSSAILTAGQRRHHSFRTHRQIFPVFSGCWISKRLRPSCGQGNRTRSAA